MAKSEKNKDKKKAKFSVLLLLSLIVFIGLVFMPATIVIVLLMAPTIVAMITDKDPDKVNTATIGSMNFAGVIPSTVQLFQEGPFFITAERIITSPNNLLLAYGAAGIGWFIYLNITPLVSKIAVKKIEMKIKRIDKNQQELIRKWGKDVSIN